MAETEVRFEVARLQHVHLVASRMRAADKAEIWASGHHRPARCLRLSLKRSALARTAFIAGEAACMFGVVVEDGLAFPWLLTTDTIDRYPMSFWRASKHVIAQLRQRFPIMVQRVDERYPAALRWATRLGFKGRDTQPFGAEQLPFRLITLGGEPCANH